MQEQEKLLDCDDVLREQLARCEARLKVTLTKRDELDAESPGCTEAANKRAKELESAVGSEAPVAAVPSDADENRLAQELAKARKALADRQQQAGAAQASIKAHDGAVKRWEQAQEDWKAANAAFADHGTRPGAVPDADFKALRSAMQAAEAALADAESAHFQATSPMIAARTRIEQLETLGGSCVLASDIPCPMTQDQIAKLREAARAALSDVQQAGEAASVARRAARVDCTSATDAFSGAQRLRAAGEAWDAKAEFLRERLERAQAALDSANAEYKANPAPNPAVIQSNLASAQERVDVAEADLRAVQEPADQPATPAPE